MAEKMTSEEDAEPSKGKDQGLELLKLNYQNLHSAVWEGHKVAWTITGIFLPALFALQGYLIKQYHTVSPLQVTMGAFITELLVYVWWRFMRMLRHYNWIRRNKLRKIERVFSRQVNMSFEQHRLNRKNKYSAMLVYKLVFVLFTAMNICLVLRKVELREDIVIGAIIVTWALALASIIVMEAKARLRDRELQKQAPDEPEAED